MCSGCAVCIQRMMVLVVCVSTVSSREGSRDVRSPHACWCEGCVSAVHVREFPWATASVRGMP